MGRMNRLSTKPHSKMYAMGSAGGRGSIYVVSAQDVAEGGEFFLSELTYYIFVIKPM